MENLRKKKRTRNGNREFVKRILAEVRQMMDSALEDKQLLQNRKITLEDQLQGIQSHYSGILRLLEDVEDLEEDVLLSEIKEAGLLRTKMKESIRRAL